MPQSFRYRCREGQRGRTLFYARGLQRQGKPSERSSCILSPKEGRESLDQPPGAGTDFVECRGFPEGRQRNDDGDQRRSRSEQAILQPLLKRLEAKDDINK